MLSGCCCPPIGQPSPYPLHTASLILDFSGTPSPQVCHTQVRVQVWGSKLFAGGVRSLGFVYPVLPTTPDRCNHLAQRSSREKLSIAITICERCTLTLWARGGHLEFSEVAPWRGRLLCLGCWLRCPSSAHIWEAWPSAS